jgi:ABC-type uncharacterized transport system ATPase subunit
MSTWDGGLAHAPAIPRIQLERIAKAFGQVKALEDVSLSVGSGRVHALLGENGAGKTTLMRILYGLTRPDSGSIRIDGENLRIPSPKVARRYGIGMVTQHFALVGPMTVAENLSLTTGASGLLSRRRQSLAVSELSENFGLDIDPDAVVEDLPVGGRQRVEILKALAGGCSTLVLDEPTAVLTPDDVSSLFALVRGLCADSGLAVIFISHKMHEVLDICDDLSVLRHGRIVSTQRNENLNIHELTRLMIGEDSVEGEVLVGGVDVEHARIAKSLSDRGSGRQDPVLSVRELSVIRDDATLVEGVSLELFPGEIVGVAGVTGNGQSELVSALLGLREPTRGDIQVSGVPVQGSGVQGRRAAGLAGVSEDRHSLIVGELSVAENLALADSNKFKRGLVLNKSGMTANAELAIDHFSIKATPTQAAGTLSGGNMQKVLLARMFQAAPEVAIVAQPTRGLDVSSTAQVRKELVEGAEKGTAVLVISEDLDEVLELAHRVLVMYRGQIIGELSGGDATAQRIGQLMAGVGGTP